MESFIEKRRDPRADVSFVSVDVCSAIGDSLPAEFCPVINLSAGGMKFSARNRYEPGRFLRLTFLLPGTNVSIRTDAVVVHQSGEHDLLGTGVQFRNLGLAERKLLRQFVETLLSSDTSAGCSVPAHKNEKKLKLSEISSDCNREGSVTTGIRETDKATELLIKQCVANDRRAQQTLFRTYRNTVFSLICRLLGPEFDFDDVLQQVFISIFKSLKHFRGLSSLDTWVYRITMKVITDQLRRKYRKRKLTLAGSIDDTQSGLTGATHHTPHSGLERKELYDKINAALGKLTLEKRLVVVMYEIEGKSLEEIADILEKPVGTVKSRLFHARHELEKHLRKYMYDTDGFTGTSEPQ